MLALLLRQRAEIELHLTLVTKSACGVLDIFVERCAIPADSSDATLDSGHAMSPARPAAVAHADRCIR